MYYEIIVSIREEAGQYRHFFATDERSITDNNKLHEVYWKFVYAFPAPMYEITVIKWMTRVGTPLDMGREE